MVTPVKTKAKIVTDNTGVESELPVLVTEQGVLEPLLDYLLSHQHDRSISWMERVVHATYLLMQYMEANQNCFYDPNSLFQSFVQRLYTGTIREDGFDPSGLFWLPTSTLTANGLITALTRLTDFLVNQLDIRYINPLRPASSFEERLNYAAWFRRNQFNFLGHIKYTSINETVSMVRNIRGRRSTVKLYDDAIAFPEKLFAKFYLKGLGGAKDIRVATRNQLILLMMHFAGCRGSDCLHLWIEDVLVDPLNKDNVIVRLYDPQDGKAPGNWRGRNGATNRAAYLQEQYALTPRNKIIGKNHVGWKYQVVDNRDNYIQLFWFPHQSSFIFAQLWRNYCRYLTTVERHHPYAFVSFEGKTAGQPLTINAFHDAYRKALYRVGKTPSKVEGFSPHGHRHAMGRRLERAGLPPRIIQKVLHHKSITSQASYTVPGIEQVSQTLQQGYTVLEQKAKTEKSYSATRGWNDLLQYGFENIDPNGLFSGPSLKESSS
jgi:integrase